MQFFSVLVDTNLFVAWRVIAVRHRVGAMEINCYFIPNAFLSQHQKSRLIMCCITISAWIM